MTELADTLGEPRRLHPATLLARWLKIVPQLIAAGIALAVSAGRRGTTDVLLTFGAVAGIGALAAAGFALLYWWRFTYAIHPGEIVIEKGLLHRQRRVIPFDRIQDVAIEQRLLARIFGTARVRIETGGSASNEGNLDMIALGDAHALRDFVRRGAAPAPTGAPAQADGDSPSELHEAEPLLFSIAFPRLLLAGLFNFSLIFIAAIMGFLEYLDQLGLVRWEDLVTAESAERAASILSVRVAASALLVLLVLGLVAGVARTVARDFGFTLTRSPAGFRRRRGLFTLSEVVIPLRRTQVAVIDSGWIARLFGWYALSFQTLGADRKEGGVQVAAPFARMDELLPILAEAGFPEPPPRTTFHILPRRAIVARIMPYLLLSLIAAAAALLVEPLVAIAAAAMLVLGALAALRWRKHAWLIAPDALFVSSGLFRRRLWILPHVKTQAIFVSRGPIQRPLGLASLLVDTAGGQLVRTPEIADLDAAEAERAADRLLLLYSEARAVMALKHRAATDVA